MNNIAIVTDTGSGMSQAQGLGMGIHVLPMPFTINGTDFYEGLDRANETAERKRIERDEFFDLLEKDANVLTSQPSITDVTDLWDKLLEDHDEIIHIPFTSGLSGTYQTAAMLADQDEYQGRVYVCDSHKVAIMQKQNCLDAQKLASLGYTGREIKDILEKRADNCSLYACVGTLKHLKKGGRITPAVAAIGTLLKLRPVLQLVDGGRLDKYSVARTNRQCRDIIISAIKKDLVEKYHDPECHNGYLSILYSDNPEEAADLASQLEFEFPGRVHRKIATDALALNLCCHTGPGVLGIALYEELDELCEAAKLQAVI